jgi:hypothetical protein
VELRLLGRETTVVALAQLATPMAVPVVVVVRAQSVAPVRATPVVPVVRVAHLRLLEHRASTQLVVAVPVVLWCRRKFYWWRGCNRNR